MAACYWLTEEALGSEDLVSNLSETLSWFVKYDCNNSLVRLLWILNKVAHEKYVILFLAHENGFFTIINIVGIF